MDAHPEHLPRLYSEQQAAEYLDVSIWTVKRRIADGSLRAIPVGRRRAKKIREGDLLAYVGGACQKTEPADISSNAEAHEGSTASVGMSMDRHAVLQLAHQISSPRAKRSTPTR